MPAQRNRRAWEDSGARWPTGAEAVRYWSVDGSDPREARRAASVTVRRVCAGLRLAPNRRARAGSIPPSAYTE